jgi:hypothetical protein
LENSSFLCTFEPKIIVTVKKMMEKKTNRRTAAPVQEEAQQETGGSLSLQPERHAPELGRKTTETRAFF